MANPFRIRSFRISDLRLKLKRPFVTALGVKTATRNAGFQLTLAGGAEGYGEASTSLALKHLSAGNMAAVLRRLGGRALGQDCRRWRRLIEAAWRQEPGCQPAVAAFECALLDAWTRALGTSLHRWLGAEKKSLKTDITISALPAKAAGRAAVEAAAEGFDTLKVKLGARNSREDLQRVLQVRAAAPGARIILDGNQGLSVESACRFVEACLKIGVRPLFLEQPLPRSALTEHRELRKRLPIPVALDESVMSPRQALEVLDAEAADILNVKIAKCGILMALDIIALATAAGKKLMIGCMQESARGLSASVHLACGTGAFSAVDLDSDHLIAGPQPQGDFARRGPLIRLSAPASSTVEEPLHPRRELC
ncbi:MAG: hypothetical protein A3G41_02025 [Elusimicrobia bacterium RIFCSPLOWO2_12_FULL_59_9]|nr:MAG: hypothetical protein A3G41_02025 [Elusimicrobia bacterium RIFCSPLOWO2_12_FULL_59_9]